MNTHVMCRTHLGIQWLHDCAAAHFLYWPLLQQLLAGKPVARALGGWVTVTAVLEIVAPPLLSCLA